MELTAQMYLTVLPMVFIAAVVDSICGGGGLISLPAYTLAGLNYDLASGTNKFSAMFGTLSATVRYLRSGKIMLAPALWATLMALPGSYIGTRLAMLLGSGIMTVVMIVMLPIVAMAVLFKGKREKQTEPKPMNRLRLFLCAVTGFAVGLYDGFFGPGTGTFLIILFTWVCGMDMVTASGTAKPVNLASNVASLITRISAGQVLFALAIPAMVCSLTGGYIGALLAVRKGARLVRYVMLCVLALLMVKLIYDMLA